MPDIYGEHLSVIARHRASFGRLHQPFRDQALGKFALRIFVAEHRPAPAGVEQALQLLLVRAARSRLQPAATQPAIQPQPGADGQCAAPAVLIECQQKMYGMHQVRALPQQAPAFEQRLAYQSDLGMFQVAQASMNDARGPTGGAGGKVMLLNQQGSTAGASALPGDGDAVNSAADNDHLEAFARQRTPDWGSVVHNRAMPAARLRHCPSITCPGLTIRER